MRLIESETFWQEYKGLALGTWAFSGARIWGPGDDENSIRTVHCALDNGVTLIDSAERYGNGKAEEVLGQALKGRRGEAMIATKVYTDALTYDALIASCEASMRRLQTDYLDILQIHWPSETTPWEETMRALNHLMQAGKIRAWSACNFGPDWLKKTEAQKPLCNQLAYSLVWRAIEHEIMPACEAAGVPVWAYCPLGQGLLTGKYRSIEDVPLGRRETRIYDCDWGQSRHTEHGFEKPVFDYLAQLRALANESGVSIPAMAFAFLKSKPQVGGILVGARSTEQLTQNLDAYRANVPEEVLKKAVALSEPLKATVGRNADLWISANGGRIH